MVKARSVPALTYLQFVKLIKIEIAEGQRIIQ